MNIMLKGILGDIDLLCFVECYFFSIISDRELSQGHSFFNNLIDVSRNIAVLFLYIKAHQF